MKMFEFLATVSTRKAMVLVERSGTYPLQTHFLEISSQSYEDHSLLLDYTGRKNHFCLNVHFSNML